MAIFCPKHKRNFLPINRYFLSENPYRDILQTMIPFLRTYCDERADLQSPYDVAVVIPTVLRASLCRALRSIFEQDHQGRIQVLIGIDLPLGDFSAIEDILLERPSHISVTFLWLGYSTKIKRGGNWQPWGGGGLRTILSFLANARYIAYLDDDNWYGPDHLSSLLSAIKNKSWAFSRRWFVHEDKDEPICEDIWESVGPNKGVFKDNFGGFVDTNCYMIDKLKTLPVLAYWCITDGRFHHNSNEGGEDRVVFHYLNKHYKDWGDTAKPTVSYRISGKDINDDVRWKYIDQNKIKLGREACPNWTIPNKKQNSRLKYNNFFGSLQTLGDINQPFAITVIIPTTARDSLIEAVQSIYQQDYEQPVQILIGVDCNGLSADQIKRLNEDRPSHMSVMILDAEYSTSKRHGGIHEAYDGGALRSLLSFAAKAPYVAYLDDDNRWLPNHLSSLTQTIGKAHYAYSLRHFIHPDRKTSICVDLWESLGPNKGYYSAKFGGFIDPNCYLFNVRTCLNVLPLWSTPLKNDPEKMSADRRVFLYLKTYGKGICTRKASTEYILSEDDPMHPLRTMYLGYHWINANYASQQRKTS